MCLYVWPGGDIERELNGCWRMGQRGGIKMGEINGRIKGRLAWRCQGREVL